MNRYLNQNSYSFIRKPVHIYAQVTFGASGAPTLNAPNSVGLVSVTRNSAGNLTFQFGTKAGMLDVHSRLLGVRHTLLPGAAAPAAPSIYVTNDSTKVVGVCSLTVQLNAAGTATDPASGEMALFEFLFAD